jgi:hypothetical protein
MVYYLIGVLDWLILRPWRWRRHVPLKRRFTFNGQHCVISQKIKLVHYLVHKRQSAVNVWSTLIRSTYSHPLSLGSILILSSHIHLGLPSDFYQVLWPLFCMPVYNNAINRQKKRKIYTPFWKTCFPIILCGISVGLRSKQIHLKDDNSYSLAVNFIWR